MLIGWLFGRDSLVAEGCLLQIERQQARALDQRPFAPIRPLATTHHSGRRLDRKRARVRQSRRRKGARAPF